MMEFLGRAITLRGIMSIVFWYVELISMKSIVER